MLEVIDLSVVIKDLDGCRSGLYSKFGSEAVQFALDESLVALAGAASRSRDVRQLLARAGTADPEYRAYIRETLKSKARDWIRAQRRERKRQEHLRLRASTDSGSDPRDALERAETTAATRALLEAVRTDMASDDDAMFALEFFEHLLSRRAFAKIHRMPRSTAGARIARGAAALRRALIRRAPEYCSEVSRIIAMLQHGAASVGSTIPSNLRGDDDGQS